MAEIIMHGGEIVTVDDTDFEWLNQWHWHIGGSGYAMRSEYIKGSGRKNQKNKLVRMHRFIVNAPDKMLVDHINGNKLDNRRGNLRLATHSENHQNRDKQTNNTSGYKGVFLHDKTLKRPWRVRIAIPGNPNKHIGFFATREEAAKAYNEAAIKYHKEFARLNNG